MTEFIIVFPVMFILIFGALQIAFLYHAKTTLNYATFLAARSGAVSNGHLGIMENALARGMAPLYSHCDNAAEVLRARDQVRTEIQNGFAFIEILNPPVTAFGNPISPAARSGVRSGDRALRMNIDGTPDTVIPNDSLMYRPTNPGLSSGQSIQDANILKIRAHYCYPLYVPFIDNLLVRIMTQAQNTDNTSPDYCPECQGLYQNAGTFERGCLDNDRFPLNSQAIVRMQSPAIQSAMDPTVSSMYPGPAAANTVIAFTPANCP
ncbi:MAG: pilus assembly protein [Proteobacteria bacterium]|nr:pilus assembly protein [Pseudomonadota bacterium]